LEVRGSTPGALFRGVSLTPPPPGVPTAPRLESGIHEGDGRQPKPYTLLVTPRVKKITLAEGPGGASASVPGESSAWQRTASWFVTPLMLMAVVLGLALVFLNPAGLALLVIGGVVLAFVLWIVISLFFPGRADPRCPKCGELGLEASELDDVQGIRCSACGFEDAEASSWMFAEGRDGPLENIVMKSRGRAPLATGSTTNPDETP